MTDGGLAAGRASFAAADGLGVIAALRPVALRFRVEGAFVAAARPFLVTAAFRVADVPIGQLLRLMNRGVWLTLASRAPLRHGRTSLPARRLHSVLGAVQNTRR
jgi:hypothetical protein